MSDAIVTFFICLVVYRGLCWYCDAAPFPVVNITINNNNFVDDDA